MPIVDALVECPLYDSFRVRTVLGMFDVPLPERLTERFTVELPGLDEDWQIGVIVGPSASGKTTVARHAFGEQLYHPGTGWPTDRAVIDGFPGVPMRDVTAALTSVGFSSPPSWLRPYAVLSNGEKFRCDLAKALVGMGIQARWHEGTEARSESQDADVPSPDLLFPSCLRASVPSCLHSSPLTVFDEFTSVVDRTVAKIGSAAVSKAIRSGRIPRRFVAVTCHYDVVPWLEPDWVLDMAARTLSRRRLRRPDIRLEIRRVPTSHWQLFKRHHYLSGDLHRSAACFGGFVDGSPATFTAALFFPHATRPGWREHRTVCLPDFQGVGLGHATSEFIASLYRATGRPYYSTSSHPAMIRHRCRSPLWRVTRKPRTSTTPHEGVGTRMARTGSVGRLTGSFEYVGPARGDDAARLGAIARSTGDPHHGPQNPDPHRPRKGGRPRPSRLPGRGDRRLPGRP